MCVYVLIHFSFHTDTHIIFNVDDSTYYNAWLDTILASTPRDPLEISLSPIIRLRAKRFKEAINVLQDPWVNVDFERISKNEKQVLINLIHIQ
jgi:hypothetical protein